VIKSITTHIKRNFPKKEFYPKLVKYISEIADPESLAEPDLKSELKPMMKEALQRFGYKVHPTEIKIEPRTRADMVGYKRRYETEEKARAHATHVCTP
jgi:hypothetical protein